MSDTLYVLAAAYDDVEDALAECEAIKVAHRHVGSTHDFDASTGMRREDLMSLGQVLDERDAGLVIVYAADMADRVGAGITRATRTARATTTLSAEQLAAKLG
jgi:hypothetical protein